MPARVELKNHLSLEVIRAYAFLEAHPRQAVRWVALMLIAQGMSGREAARYLGMSTGWVSSVVRRYNEFGPEGVWDVKMPKPIRKRKVTRAAEQGLNAYLAARLKAGRIRVNIKQVVGYLDEKHNVQVHPSTAGRYVRKLGYGHMLPTRTRRA